MLSSLGVAIGAAADLYVEPGAAIGIGFVAGALSVYGYQVIAPLLDRRFNVKDTCGVHNLHGMPGILAAIVSVIVVRVSGSGGAVYILTVVH